MIEVTIKEAAQKKKVSSPTELAKRMNCAPAIVWRYWTGNQKPGLEMIDRICEALGCDIKDVIKRTRSNGANGKPSRRKAG